MPSIAGQVKELTLFQRTPPWILPRMDQHYSSRTKSLFRRVPGLQRLFRSALYFRLEAAAFGFLGNRKLMQRVEKLALDYLARAVDDPATREALTPHYQIGCKRILISDDYYTAFNRPNVSLVTTAIDHADETGIVTTMARIATSTFSSMRRAFAPTNRWRRSTSPGAAAIRCPMTGGTAPRPIMA